MTKNLKHIVMVVIFVLAAHMGTQAASKTNSKFVEMNQKDFLLKNQKLAKSKGVPFDVARCKIEFFRIDLNDNGIITLREWNQKDNEDKKVDEKTFIRDLASNENTMFYSKNPEKMFQFVDVDKDKFISVWEMSYFKKRLIENGKPFKL